MELPCSSASSAAPERPSDAPSEADGLALGGVVETALARALEAAAQAGRWDVVQQIAGELQARREAREGNAGGADVVALVRGRPA